MKFQSGRRIKCRAQFFIKLALQDILREQVPGEMLLSFEDEEEKGGGESSTSNTQSSTDVDDDDGGIEGVSAVYRSISPQLKYIHSCFLNCTSTATNTSNNSNNTTGQSSNSPPSATPRKIRPITQVAAEELRQQRLQKQLRQWFWWRYGSQRQLVEALTSYILEQLLYPRYPKTASNIQTRKQVPILRSDK